MRRELYFETVGNICYNALLSEVSATPKPGLVDRANNGAHRDMDITTFLGSAEALKPFFCAFTEYGYDSAALSEKESLGGGRRIGLEAEEAMFDATDGVNTHKGIIFSGGLICMAAGRLFRLGESITAHKLCDTVAKTVEGISLADYSEKALNKAKLTNGERIYRKYGIKGPRGEAEGGFFTVRRYGLPFYKAALDDNMDENEAMVRTLLNIMTAVDDTNVINRGGKEACEFVKQKAGEFLYGTLEEIKELDGIFTEKNLSPGGCADLLAVTLMLYGIEKTFGDK